MSTPEFADTSAELGEEDVNRLWEAEPENPCAGWAAQGYNWKMDRVKSLVDEFGLGALVKVEAQGLNGAPTYKFICITAGTLTLWCGIDELIDKLEEIKREGRALVTDHAIAQLSLFGLKVYKPLFEIVIED